MRVNAESETNYFIYIDPSDPSSIVSTYKSPTNTTTSYTLGAITASTPQYTKFKIINSQEYTRYYKNAASDTTYQSERVAANSTNTYTVYGWFMFCVFD